MISIDNEGARPVRMRPQARITSDLFMTSPFADTAADVRSGKGDGRGMGRPEENLERTDQIRRGREQAARALRARLGSSD